MMSCCHNYHLFRAPKADVLGMTCLHHAARFGWAQEVGRMLELCPALAEAKTYAARNLGNWTALHCVPGPQFKTHEVSILNEQIIVKNCSRL